LEVSWPEIELGCECLLEPGSGAESKMAKEDWRRCVEWLVRCQTLSSDHKLARDDAQVFDLAQFIRDGVLLCHLLNHLHPGAIDPKDFSQRPQMSQVTMSRVHSLRSAVLLVVQYAYC